MSTHHPAPYLSSFYWNIADLGDIETATACVLMDYGDVGNRCHCTSFPLILCVNDFVAVEPFQFRSIICNPSAFKAAINISSESRIDFKQGQ